MYSRSRIRIAIILSTVMLAVYSTRSQGQEASPSAWQFEYDTTLQVIHERARLNIPPARDSADLSAAELRLDLRIQCEHDRCRGLRAVLKPRAWLGDESKPDELPSQRPDPLAEGYFIVPIGNLEAGAGKRLLGWGPSLLYSPTNRLFPDNGAVTPRRDIPGKPMAFASFSMSEHGRVNVLVGNPSLDQVPGIRSSGTFALARGEWNWVTERSATVGAVLGGGGGFRPYAGGYFQYGLNDAWTLGAEVAGSRGYADREGEGLLLTQNGNEWLVDGTVGLRYGATSGAETGLELIYNGYALSQAELANPLIAAAPSRGSSPSRNRPLHPLVQSSYMLLQTTWPKLFGDRRWSFTGRLLRGLDDPSSDVFGELSYSPSDASIVYLGASRSWVPDNLVVSRPVTRDVYLAMELRF